MSRSSSAKINEIGAQLGAAPAELAALLQEQLQAALDEATALVTPQIRQLDLFLDDLNGAIGVDTLTGRYQAVLDRLAPVTVDAIGTLDFAADDAVAAVDADLRAARLLLEDLAQDTALNLASAAALAPVFNVDAWMQRVISAATIAASAEVRDLASMLSGWQDILVQAQQFVGSLSLDSVLRQLRDLVGQIEPVLAQFNLEQIKTTLLQGIQTVSGLAATVRQAQIDVLTGLQSLANSITQAVDAIDLSLVTNAIDNALVSGGPGDRPDREPDRHGDQRTADGAYRLQTELSSLVTSLTDAAGEVRSAIEGFLNSINDAIPDDIPQTLESVGQLIADAVAGLDEILLDPVFDTVVAELDDMRQQLQEIDVASLNALLQAALAAALAIFQAFDFPQEVEDLLIGEFDNAVEPLAEQAIDTIQDQVDGILATCGATIQPCCSIPWASLPLTMKWWLSSTASGRLRRCGRPSTRCGGPPISLKASRRARCCSRCWGRLQQLRQFLDGLSLEPIFAQLQQVLGRLNSLLAQLDITPFIGQIGPGYGPGAPAAQWPADRGRPAGIPAASSRRRDGGIERGGSSGVATAVGGCPDCLAGRHRRCGLDCAQRRLRRHCRHGGQPATAQLAHELSIQGAGSDRWAERLGLAGQVERSAQHPARHQTGVGESRGAGRCLGRGAAPGACFTQPTPWIPWCCWLIPCSRFRELQTALGELAGALDRALSDGGALSQPLDALSNRLREMTVGIVEGATDLKQVLRDAIDQAYQAMGVGAIAAIYQQVKETFQSFSPDNLEAALTELVQPVRDWLDNLLDPSEVLGEVVEAFNSFKALIDPGLSDFLDQVRADVQPIVDGIVAKVSALDPSAVLTQLDAKYQAIIAVKDRLVGKLESMLSALDEPYQLILGLIDQMNPGTVLVEPLSDTYQAILDKLAGVDIRLVFQPLLDAIRRLREALVVGYRPHGDCVRGLSGRCAARERGRRRRHLR